MNPSPAATYNDVAMYARRILRKYSVESVCDLALQSFAKFRGKGELELRSAPWLTALLVKLAVEDKQIPLVSTNRCPAEVFDSLRQKMWDVPSLSSRDGSVGAVLLGLRVLLHTQLLFQQKETFSFLRWPALILELPNEHPTRVQFEQVMGMTPTTFIGMCWAGYAKILTDQSIIPRAYFQSLEPLYGEGVAAFLRLFSRDLRGLRQEARVQFEKRLNVARAKGDVTLVRPATEVAEFPWLQRYPLLLLPSGDYAVWHSLIYARGIEDAAHRTLSGLGQAYTDPFSREFEKYVLQLLNDSGLQYRGEDSFKAQHGRDAPAVEAILDLDHGNVLIESKMSVFPDEVVFSDSASMVFTKLLRVRQAIVQGWRVAQILSVERQPETGVARQNYLIVITSRQLNVCNGEQLKRLFGDSVFEQIASKSKLGALSEQQRSFLPPKNMFFISIEEFEHLCGCVSKGEVDIWSLLSSAADAQTDFSTSVFHFDQLLGKYTKKWVTPAIQLQARDRVEAELVDFFGQR